jgi:hypothetical protein
MITFHVSNLVCYHTNKIANQYSVHAYASHVQIYDKNTKGSEFEPLRKMSFYYL